jgi:hypothetical protein
LNAREEPAAAMIGALVGSLSDCACGNCDRRDGDVSPDVHALVRIIRYGAC